ncbi:ATP-dependent helicase HrpB [Paenibacillus hamazuiensis]|uniref:ATP-dependent helicase HrpB n=1 Tax=Paenibacillus hamazuiensis TaxID=2936508 RepID=UPI00200CA99E|nr:ATP-dependent helicase HrpB [Paenibacillus hamazuiensis]
MNQLPIDAALPELRRRLRASANAVLVASPGAGKTTRVPLALLDEPWLQGRRILMLEPRRIAARSAARYMAAQLGEAVGETVGYRVRMDTKAGPSTRIEVITEGVLTRMLQDDPTLEQAGIVLFDEFHERSLHADLGLALVLQAQELLRPDLKVLVMSATLDAEPVAALLGDAPVVTSEGRAYPVETRYLQRRPDGPIEPEVVRAVRDALEREDGDILAFLPGAGEIRRVEARLAELALGPRVRVMPLHGSLPHEAQDRAIAPGAAGERKVVLATSIAETSLTVEGVRVVIDSGLARTPRFSPRTGMTRLITVPVSRASADQRRGRAGRTAPGVCYRLWTEADDRLLPPRSTPELLAADLAPLALELAAWGTADPAELRWLDPPPQAALGQARELLTQLGALDGAGAITAHGRKMAELGAHPRLAHMLLRAAELRLGGLACELAALLSERDILRGDGAAPDADLRLRLAVLRRVAAGASPGAAADEAACRRALAEAKAWRQALRLPPGAAGGDDAAGLLLAFAYPERIAQRRADGRYLLRSGRGAAFAGVQPLAKEPYVVAAELDDQGADSRIFLAAPLDIADLERHLGDQIETETAVAWDPDARAIRARRQTRLGALLLKDVPVNAPGPEQAAATWLHALASEGLELLPWSKTARQLRQRIGFMHRVDPGWPDMSDEALLASAGDWLIPYLHGMKSAGDLQRLNLTDILEAMLSWEQRRELDAHAPTHIQVPSGSRIPVDYGDPAAPVLAVRLQEMFGLSDTPRIGRGKVPLTLHLLSPAHRPVQVTRDLASFWQNAYFEVKKDLKGRYPKHYWPDDPLSAPPTHRAKPRV